jgi:cytoskeletal protein RodZ
MNNVGKKLEIFVIVSIIAFIGIIYAFKQQPAVTANTDLTQNQSAQTDATAPITSLGTKGESPSDGLPQQQVPTTTISYQGEDGKSAVELLTATHKVELKEGLVSSIDGIEPDAEHFWAMYVNGKYVPVGTDHATKSGDTVQWEIDAKEDTTK